MKGAWEEEAHCYMIALLCDSCWKLCDYWRLPSSSPRNLTGPTRRIITNYPTTATLVPPRTQQSESVVWLRIYLHTE